MRSIYTLVLCLTFTTLAAASSQRCQYLGDLFEDELKTIRALEGEVKSFSIVYERTLPGSREEYLKKPSIEMPNAAYKTLIADFESGKTPKDSPLMRSYLIENRDAYKALSGKLFEDMDEAFAFVNAFSKWSANFSAKVSKIARRITFISMKPADGSRPVFCAEHFEEALEMIEAWQDKGDKTTPHQIKEIQSKEFKRVYEMLSASLDLHSKISKALRLTRARMITFAEFTDSLYDAKDRANKVQKQTTILAETYQFKKFAWQELTNAYFSLLLENSKNVFALASHLLNASEALALIIGPIEIKELGYRFAPQSNPWGPGGNVKDTGVEYKANK